MTASDRGPAPATGTSAPDGPQPVDDEAKARDLARVAVLRIVVMVLGAILVVLAIVVFSTLILRAVKGGSDKRAETRAVEAARSPAPGAAPGPKAVPAAPAGGVPFAVAAQLPAGARVVSTALGEGRLAVTVEAGGGLTTILFDVVSGRETGRIVLSAP